VTEIPFHIVIPARFNSSRLPGKPLIELAGRAMIEHVYLLAEKSSAQSSIVATDDQRIADHCASKGIPVTMTAVEHASGTDRIGEVVEQQGWSDDEIVVGLQGDEPATPPGIINQVARNLARHPDASMATLCAEITEHTEFLDPNRVKVVFDSSGYALYFSRAAIPYRRDRGTQSGADRPVAYVHIGIYAYLCRFLRQYRSMSMHPLEREEKLEQLRALGNGHRIHVEVAMEAQAHGVDTLSDVAVIEQVMLKQQL